MGAKKIAAVVVLIVVIVVAVFFIMKRSGMVAGGPTPPASVLEERIERIDMNSGEVVTKQYQEWQKLGQKDGAYKNPATGQYTMVIPEICAACRATIGLPAPPANVRADKGNEALAQWQQSIKCPKCGKNPFGGGAR